MYKIGGYTMNYQDAKAWALRRFPNIDFKDKEYRLIPYIIQAHNKSLGGQLACKGVYLNNELLCIFVTHSENDPAASRAGFDAFIETDEDKMFRRKTFTHKEDFEKAQFMTICDPSGRGY